MISNWTFDKNGQAGHIPCGVGGLAFCDFKNPLSCYICHEQLPEELELPAKVFGAYKFISLNSFEEIMNKIITKKIKVIEKAFFLGHYGK